MLRNLKPSSHRVQQTKANPPGNQNWGKVLADVERIILKTIKFLDIRIAAIVKRTMSAPFVNLLKSCLATRISYWIFQQVSVSRKTQGL